MTTNSQSKPQGDEDVIETFSLQERRKVAPDPVSQQDQMDRTIRRQFKRIQDDTTQSPAPSTGQESQVAGGQQVSTALMESLLAQMRSEIESVRSELEKVRADVASLSGINGHNTSSNIGGGDARQPDKNSPQANFERRIASGEPLTEDKIKAAEKFAEHMPGYDFDPERGYVPTPESGEKEEKESEGKKEIKANQQDRTLSDGLPVAIDVRGKIYIPGVASFEIWNEISNLPSGQRRLSLKCTVAGLSVTGYSFVDEFSTGEIEDMVEVDGDTLEQTEFTLPLAERIAGQGNSWVVCTQGGFYTTPIFCVNGKPVIYPIKHT